MTQKLMNAKIKLFILIGLILLTSCSHFENLKPIEPKPIQSDVVQSQPQNKPQNKNNKNEPSVLYADYVRNYDGDTITVNIENLPFIFGQNLNIRLLGIDTPEIRGKCPQEKKLAIQSKEFVQERLLKYPKIKLIDLKRGKYFRVIATVLYNGGMNLNQELLDHNLARYYDGTGKRKSWCSN